MSAFKSLLVELGAEELPARALPALARAFLDGICAGLQARRVAFQGSWTPAEARLLYTPRRLAVLIPGVAVRQSSQAVEIHGPPVSAALDAAGRPTAALTGFAAKSGVAIEALERVWQGSIERFVLRRIEPGAETAALVGEVVAEAIRNLPVPKPMRWGNRDFGFARPVHWLVVLLGADVVDCEVLGLKADRISRGHRFHAPKPLWINEPRDYVDVLRRARVMVDAGERSERLRADIRAAARKAGGEARIPEALLEEVNCLVEWPRAVACSFEPEFLRVPQEALILTMETNQRFFPVLDAKGRLSDRFVAVANIESSDEAQVRRGFERVIRPRFADAGFFFDEDLKQPLSRWAEGLGKLAFQQKLGSYADKADRVTAIILEVAPAAGADVDLARRAAALAKADLLTRMVGEFPELQGTMGRYYANAAREPEALATALEEAYLPRFAGDAVAATPLGRALAVADRIDTLVGGFAAGLKPTGNKDPFALRRAALALGRTLVEGAIDLDLHVVLRRAGERLPSGVAAAPTDELYDFVLERMRGYYSDLGTPPDHFVAVLEVRPGSPYDFHRRLAALREFVRLPDSAALAAANKRLRNILRKSVEPIADQVQPWLLREPSERALHDALQGAARDNFLALKEHDYVQALQRLARLRREIDAFFADVMVLVDDAALRGNRLALLNRLHTQFLAVADVSQLALPAG